jgi:hypothetical protein
MLEYCKEFGHCNVPQKDTYECVLLGMGQGGADYIYKGTLGVWLRTQRRLRKLLMRETINQLSNDQSSDEGLSGDRLPGNRKSGGTRMTLSPDQLAKLQQLVDEGKLLWDASERRGNKTTSGEWRRHYAALLEYRRIHGHCNVPQSQTFECDLSESRTDAAYTGRLGVWLSTQRVLYKSKRLAPDRLELLQRLVDEGVLFISYLFCILCVSCVSPIRPISYLSYSISFW